MPPASSAILLANVLFALLYFYGVKPLPQWVGGQLPWAPLTFPYLFVGIQAFVLWALILLIFWLIASDLERIWGTPKFLVAWFAVTVSTGWLLLLVNRHPVGLFYPLASVLVAWTVVKPDLFSLPGLPAGSVLLRFLALGAVYFGTGPVAGLAALAPNLVLWGWTAALPGRQLWPQRTIRPARVEPEPEGPPPVRPPGPPEELIDRILEQVREHGLDSLSPDERARLDEHSSWLREEG